MVFYLLAFCSVVALISGDGGKDFKGRGGQGMACKDGGAAALWRRRAALWWWRCGGVAAALRRRRGGGGKP